MRNTFTYDGVTSSTYGVYISGGGTFNAAARDFEVIEVPGKDGALTMDNGRFELIKHEYEAFVIPTFDSNAQGLRNQLMARRGFKRLADTYHTDEFYKAYFENGLSFEPSQNLKEGRMRISFMRDPRRFLTSGESSTTATTINNPTLFNARPLVRVVGYGTVGVGSTTITIAQHANSYIDIDSEIQDCYCGATNCNNLVTFSNNEFPVLAPGNNGITKSGNVTSVTVTPRWWRL